VSLNKRPNIACIRHWHNINIHITQIHMSNCQCITTNDAVFVRKSK